MKHGLNRHWHNVRDDYEGVSGDVVAWLLKEALLGPWYSRLPELCRAA